MGQIMYTVINPKGSINYVSGVINKIIKNSNDNRPYTISMLANVWAQDTGYTQKTIQFNLWPNQQDAPERIARLERMKLSVGSFVTAVCGNLQEYTFPKSGETVLQGPLFSLNYYIDYTIKDRERSFMLMSGFVGNINDNPDGSATIQLSLKSYNRETKTMETKKVDCLIPAKLYTSVSSAGMSKSDMACVLVTPTTDSYGKQIYSVARIEFGKGKKKD